MSLTGQLATLLGVFALALVVRLLVSGAENVSYSVMLVLAGFGVSLAGVQPPLVLVRGVVVYGVVGALNATVDEGIPHSFQHVMVWGGLHTVVPVALVLSLPANVPFRDELRVMVFGIAVLGTVVQGLLMPFVLRRTGVTG